MKREEIVVGIIGLVMGRHHLESALKCGVNVGAICDIDEAQLKKIGDEFGVPEEKRFTDYHDLLNNPEINVVLLVVPDQLHLTMTEEFLAAGKHVLCEKPLALTREELKGIIRATDASDKKFMVGQICHFTPAFIKAKELLDSGAIGELYYVESEYAHDYHWIMHGWRRDPNRHGVVGGGCHAVDLLRWFAGDPEEVFAYGTHKLLPMADYNDATIAVLKFPNKVIGKVFVSTGCKRNYTMRTVIYGTKGTIVVDNTSPTMSLFLAEINGEEKVFGTKAINIEHKIPVKIANHNVAAEIAEFCECILTNTEPRISAEEGARAVAACEAIIRSSATGKPEKIVY